MRGNRSGVLDGWLVGNVTNSVLSTANEGGQMCLMFVVPISCLHIGYLPQRGMLWPGAFCGKHDALCVMAVGAMKRSVCVVRWVKLWLGLDDDVGGVWGILLWGEQVEGDGGDVAEEGGR